MPDATPPKPVNGAHEPTGPGSGSASPHFSFAELTKTATGMPNVPNDAAVASLVRLAENVLEPMRALAGPLRVNSAFRCFAVNLRVGGVQPYHDHRGSQHLYGEAADIVPIMVPLTELFNQARISDIPFDQLILEFGWIHVSTPPLGSAPRRQVLKARVASGGKIQYFPIGSTNGAMGGGIQ